MAPKQVLASRSKSQRKLDRKTLGPLENLLVTPTTQKRYDSSLNLLFRWMEQEKIPVPSETHTFDQLISQYLNYLWEEGEGRALGANTLAAIQYKVPQLRRQLMGSWRLLSAWNKHELPMRAPPLTPDLLYSLCGAAIQAENPHHAVCMMVGFFGLLRTGELGKIQVKDITIGKSVSQAVINLGLTKGGMRQGALEHVIIDFSPAVKMLQAYLLDMQPGDFILPNLVAFRAAFKNYTRSLHIQEWEFKPYSLRRGGATHHFRQSGLLSQTILKGRWMSSKSARIYINDGLATLASLKYEHLSPLLNKYERIFKQRTKNAW